MEDRLEANWNAVRQRIDDACREAGRPAEDVELLAVTKKVSCRTARALHGLGQIDLGENRASELERKAEDFRTRELEARWHFIGPLQRNKARRVVRLAETIHSIDSPRLLEAVDRLAGELGTRPGLYLEVKLTDESAKHGFPLHELADATRAAGELPNVDLLGFMGMGPRLAEASDAERRRAARECFESLADAARRLELEVPGAFLAARARLSMGMTQDLEEAVAAGSNTVRIGTALFAGLEEETTE